LQDQNVARRAGTTDFIFIHGRGGVEYGLAPPGRRNDESAGVRADACAAASTPATPNVALEIMTNPALDDVSDTSVDVFITYGDGNWPNYLLKKLYDVENLPLCSPKLLSTRGGLERPSEVLRFPLLHLTRRDEWSRWLAANGVEVDHAPGIMFSDIMVVQAVAIAGQGVMMGNNVTCTGALSAGVLVCPFSSTISGDRSYYLVIDRRKQRRAPVQAFSTWLLGLIEQLRQGNSHAIVTRARQERTLGGAVPRL